VFKCNGLLNKKAKSGDYLIIKIVMVIVMIKTVIIWTPGGG
jgi:hypothetical protein